MGEGGNNTQNRRKDDNIIDSSLQMEEKFALGMNDIPENEINKKRFSISGRILDIIDKGGESEIQSLDAEKIGKYMSKYILFNLKNIEQGNLISIFSKYINGDNSINIDNFNKKFNKYFPIHLPILTTKIRKELKILEAEQGLLGKNISSEELTPKKENLILNLLKKYSYIIFIFGEKIRLGELDKLLELDIKAISSLRESVSQNMKILERQEQKNIESLKRESNFINTDEEYSLLTDHICATTYRNTFRKVMSEGEDITIMSSLDKVGKEIEKLYKLEFKKLYTVFKKWYDSDGSLGNNLYQIEDIIKKIFGSIFIFKEANIAFTDTFSSKLKQPNFLNEVDAQLIQGNIITLNNNKQDKNIQESEEKLIELFKQLLEIIINGGKKSEFEKLEEEISILKKKTAKSKIPKTLSKIDDLDLDEVDFDEWDTTPENQKYELMFSEIIGKDGKLIISKYLQLDELDEELIYLFTQSYGIDYDIVLAQFREIKGLEKANISIRYFVKNDINNLNLIIIWWRFLLKIRKLEKNTELGIKKLKAPSDYIKKLESIKSIREKPYGVIEIISEKLKEKGILESDKLEFKPGGRLNNISVQTIPEQLKSILKGYKKGPIDLLETSIHTGKSNRLVKDLTDLYIPTKSLYHKTSSDLDNEMNGINDWLNSGIDLCFNLLQNNSITDTNEKEYLKLLKKYKIVPENTEKLEIKNKDNIKNLAEALKYIKHKRKKLKEMILIGNNDKENLIELFSPLLGDTKKEIKADGFGPEKSFTRAFTKLIKLYSGDFTLIGDLTRLRIVENDINDLTTAIVKYISFAVESDEITHVSIIDLIGEPISDPKKSSGYRDIKLLLSLKGGNVVEQQFQYKGMLDVKEIGIDLTDKEKSPIFDKLKKEGRLFTLENTKEFIKFVQKKDLELPTIDILNNLLREGNVYGLINELEIDEESLSRKNISSTYTYNIIRQLTKGSELEKKLTRLERIINDDAWSGAVLKYLENKGIQID
ncbi:MAG: hypothetical protein QM490_00800 [Candidatus Gracilibacteria bacterium]